MTGFHLDLKCAHYREDYLESLFPRLAAAGYTHVIIETEDKVRLDSTRGTEWCEAYSKETFAGILSGVREAGLVPIPLIQTLGHMESILSHRAFHDLRESPESAYMLCPSNPRSIPFLKRYMDEVGELFGNPPFIHIGADEAWRLGSCPECSRRVAEGSRSELFREHIGKLATHALSRGWRPVAWADMLLAHSDSIDRFSRDVVWVDWDYWTQESGSDTHRFWPTGTNGGAEIFPAAFFDSEMGRHARDAAGGIRPWFYSDYLMGKGFDVILAPSTRCGGDHMFAPHGKHLGNVMGASLRARRDPRPLGMLVTSWAVRLNPVEMQWPAILIPQAVTAHPATEWRSLKSVLTEGTFGKAAPAFFDAWQAIAPCFTLAESWRASETDIHYYGQIDTIPYLLGSLRQDGGVERERAMLESLLPDHARAILGMEEVARRASGPSLCLRLWQFAARAIQARAEEELLFLDALDKQPERSRAAGMLLRLEALQDEYRLLLGEIYTPASVERELGMIFGAPWRALMRLSCGKP